MKNMFFSSFLAFCKLAGASMVRVWSLSRRKELLRGRQPAGPGQERPEGSGPPSGSRSTGPCRWGRSPLSFTKTVSRVEAQGSTGGWAPRLGPRRLLSVGSQRLSCACVPRPEARVLSVHHSLWRARRSCPRSHQLWERGKPCHPPCTAGWSPGKGLGCSVLCRC